jgi:hypothetical protein
MNNGSEAYPWTDNGLKEAIQRPAGLRDGARTGSEVGTCKHACWPGAANEKS